MAQKNKETLKNYFKKGGFITEKEFVDLIDSSMNVIDDGISIKPENGLRINPIGIFSKLISFYKKKSQKKADFTIDINHNNKEGLSVNNSDENSILKIKDCGTIGVNNDDPKYNLHINGSIGASSRIGTFSNGTVPADGDWHPIVTNLDGINAFEVVAHVSGEVNSGNYSLIHAIALSTFGGRLSSHKINVSNARWGLFSFRNKIKLRWSGDLHNYSLEAKTTRNWGINNRTREIYNIKYNITKINE